MTIFHFWRSSPQRPHLQQVFLIDIEENNWVLCDEIVSIKHVADINSMEKKHNYYLRLAYIWVTSSA